MSEQHSDERSEKRNVVSHLPDAPLMTVPDAEQIVGPPGRSPRRARRPARRVRNDAVKRLAYQAHGLHDTEAPRRVVRCARELARSGTPDRRSIMRRSRRSAAKWRRRRRVKRAADAEMALELKAEVEELAGSAR